MELPAVLAGKDAVQVRFSGDLHAQVTLVCQPGRVLFGVGVAAGLDDGTFPIERDGSPIAVVPGAVVGPDLDLLLTAAERTQQEERSQARRQEGLS